MSQDVTLPSLGESVTEGTVTRWLKNVGDTVAVDEPLVEVSTDKVDTEVPSPFAGTLQEILVAEDETAEVGAILARIGDGAAAPAAASAPQEEAAAPAAEPAAAPTAEPAASPSPSPQTGDANEVTLPSLGESVTEGTVTRWLKQVGDQVNVDEALVEVSTDKVDTEVPSPFAGTLLEIRVNEDETAEVGAVLALVGDGAAAPDSQPAAESPAPAEPEPAVEAPAAPAPSAPAASAPATPAPAAAPASAPAAPQPPKRPASASDPRYVTPIVRKLATAKGVDLTQVSGTGVGGRIRKEDVLKAAEAQAAPAPAASAAPDATPVASAPDTFEVSELRGTTQKMSRLRKVIAARAVESMQQTAQLTTMVKVDVTRVAALRQAKKQEFLEKTGSKLSFLPFFTLAAVEALQSYPVINSTVKDDEIHYPDHENISIAVDTERGLLTPVVKNAGGMSLADLAKSIDDLASRTRDNKLTPDELAGGTFTVTNTGSRGALFDTPLVFLPQQAILGTGAVVKEPAVIKTDDGGEAIAIRSMVYLALSYDHRIIDGADAARFLSQMKRRLENGNFEPNLGI
ncbi:2-oxoglutarate dehydrogenase, E2 component, dihydrolipoamide succinyltransferase [Gulosibacter bifidus]|uniref:Dihydrolipoamide acetyltransferase component of pyruvate dehydrogenase complex n=1 Tax=Gulosibacter bifidus TaxID=272239 RepID=A0ABW5RFW9_9MICO|nr:2-oxoglutarate dehydrogenase, E2 component, dihydrolipoamide succinyltransferase [Gulosibacter bifidus]